MTERVKRRTQAERSAATCDALLAAAIQVLHEHGYGATSTTMVAEAAGISRGAMLHQFRTKADLMTFVVKQVYREELALYGRYLGAIQNEQERIPHYPQMAWEVLSRPSGVAVLEILQGSRSDPELARQLAPIQTRIEEDALANIGRSSGHSRELLAFMRLVVWSARGLSVAKVLAPDGERVSDAMTLLSRLIEAGLQTGILNFGGEDKPSEEIRTAD